MTSEKDQKITVIGMGYVGVPCALSFANAGEIREVIGIQSANTDASRKKIDFLNNYQNPLDKDEPYIDEILFALKYFHAEFGRRFFTVTDDWKLTEDSDVFIICVQTPVDKSGNFEHDNMISILDNIFTHSKKEKPLIVIESTVYPTFTSKFVTTYLKDYHNAVLDIDYNLAHAPERVMVGKLIENIQNFPRIIGGASEESTIRTLKLYKKLSGEPDRFITMTSTEAELTKTSENAIRDVQIALANELSSICEIYGANFYNVREGVNSLKGEGVARNLMLPGAGVGGHCLTKDTYLMFAGDESFGYDMYDDPLEDSLFRLGRWKNDYMYKNVIDYLGKIIEINYLNIKLREEPELEKQYAPWCNKFGGVEKIKEYDFGNVDLTKNGIKLGILGYSFIKNSGDFRETPTQKIIDGIFDRCCRITSGGKAIERCDVMVHDPYVDFDEVKKSGILQNGIVTTSDLSKVVNFANVLVFVVDHDEYGGLGICQLEDDFGIIGVIDCKNMFGDSVDNFNGVYYGVGRGDLNM